MEESKAQVLQLAVHLVHFWAALKYPSAQVIQPPATVQPAVVLALQLVSQAPQVPAALKIGLAVGQVTQCFSYLEVLTPKISKSWTWTALQVLQSAATQSEQTVLVGSTKYHPVLQEVHLVLSAVQSIQLASSHGRHSFKVQLLVSAGSVLILMKVLVLPDLTQVEQVSFAEQTVQLVIHFLHFPLAGEPS